MQIWAEKLQFSGCRPDYPAQIIAKIRPPYCVSRSLSSSDRQKLRNWNGRGFFVRTRNQANKYSLERKFYVPSNGYPPLLRFYTPKSQEAEQVDGCFWIWQNLSQINLHQQQPPTNQQNFAVINLVLWYQDDKDPTYGWSYDCCPIFHSENTDRNLPITIRTSPEDGERIRQATRR